MQYKIGTQTFDRIEDAVKEIRHRAEIQYKRMELDEFPGEALVLACLPVSLVEDWPYVELVYPPTINPFLWKRGAP